MQLNSQMRYFLHCLILTAHKFTIFLRYVKYVTQSNSAVLSPGHGKTGCDLAGRQKRLVNKLFRNQLHLLDSLQETGNKTERKEQKNVVMQCNM
jgi:hypothetical protein